MLKNSQFRDMNVQVFAKQSSSQWVELAQPDDPAASCSRSSGPNILVPRDVSILSRPPRVPSPATPSAAALERRLGPFDAAAIIVSNVIGGGILFTPPLVAAMVPHPWRFLAVWAGRRRARVRRRDGLRGAGGAAAARRRRVRLPARGVRPAGRVPDRVDVVRRRLLRRDRRQRRRAAPLYLGRFVPGAADATPLLHDADPVRAARRSRGRRSSRSPRSRLFALVHIRGVGPGPARQQRARDAQGHGAARLHRARLLDRRGLERESPATAGAGGRRRHGCSRSSR